MPSAFAISSLAKPSQWASRSSSWSRAGSDDSAEVRVGMLRSARKPFGEEAPRQQRPSPTASKLITHHSIGHTDQPGKFVAGDLIELAPGDGEDLGAGILGVLTLEAPEAVPKYRLVGGRRRAFRIERLGCWVLARALLPGRLHLMCPASALCLRQNCSSSVLPLRARVEAAPPPTISETRSK